MSILALLCFAVAAVLSAVQVVKAIPAGTFLVLFFLALGEVFREFPAVG